MKERANAGLIGAFILGALILLFVGLFLFGGTGWFAKRQQYVMYFEGSVYGLQVGAPVVFRGVRIGNVKNINLRFDDSTRDFLIPVTVETVAGESNGYAGARAIDLSDISEFINRGLRARLATQSLLTGQLYIELDFHPDKPLNLRSQPPNPRELPTIPSPVQELTAKLERVDFERLLNDVYAIATSVRSLLASPELKNGIKNFDSSLQNLNRISAKLDAGIDPMLNGVDASMKDLAHTLQSTREAMQGTREAMQSFEDMTVSMDKLADPNSPVLSSIQQAANEFSRAAAGLAALSDQESPSIVNLNRSLKEMSSAARALRELADSLERKPESLLKGRNPQ